MAFQLKTEVEGLSEVLELFKELPAQALDALKSAFGEDAKEVGYLLANYPPAPGGSTYMRTGELGLGWLGAKTEFVGSGSLDFQLSTTNPVAYTGYVQGGQDDSPRQSWMHKGRWLTTDQAMKATEERAVSRAENVIQELLNKYGQ